MQGFGIMGTDEPRVWSPLQGYAPWALKRVAPLGLAPPPDNWPRSTTSETRSATFETRSATFEIAIPHLTQHSIKRAALGVALIRLSGLPRRPHKPP